MKEVQILIEPPHARGDERNDCHRFKNEQIVIAAKQKPQLKLEWDNVD